jgi:hypothetical protein
VQASVYYLVKDDEGVPNEEVLHIMPAFEIQVDAEDSAD